MIKTGEKSESTYSLYVKDSSDELGTNTDTLCFRKIEGDTIVDFCIPCDRDRLDDLINELSNVRKFFPNKPNAE